jgi:two-component system, OmpR family, sensor histidine kinase CssS
MKRNTIKWRIFKYNIAVIFLLIILVAIIFNAAIRIYIEKDIVGQLNKIAARTEDTALRHGPDFFPRNRDNRMPPPRNLQDRNLQNNNELFRYYFMLDQSLREPLSVLNADYILFNNSKKIINPPMDEYNKMSSSLLSKITHELDISKNLNSETYLSFYISSVKYILIITPVAQKNNFGLGWIIIYSSLEKVNQLQLVINIILFAILILSAMIIVIFSSLVAKKISAPFSSLNDHIRALAERNFGDKLQLPVDDELRDFVNNINIMSDKLEIYDKAQKTFLQNASHEFRTPLMSIQSYSEGIIYDVVDTKIAAQIIIDESKRMTHMVEDLLYLSRLDTIDENYSFTNLSLIELINSCIDRMNGIAIKNNISINTNIKDEKIQVYADEEKLSRAITNIISNCIRYANTFVEIDLEIMDKKKINLIITDDGPGFEENELLSIFDRFYKGKKGNVGLGLAISKNVIEKHNGTIKAVNSPKGALFIINLPMTIYTKTP